MTVQGINAHLLRSRSFRGKNFEQTQPSNDCKIKSFPNAQFYNERKITIKQHKEEQKRINNIASMFFSSEIHRAINNKDFQNPKLKNLFKEMSDKNTRGRVVETIENALEERIKEFEIDINERKNFQNDLKCFQQFIHGTNKYIDEIQKKNTQKTKVHQRVNEPSKVLTGMILDYTENILPKNEADNMLNRLTLC